ncbi:hypothetical protein [Thalassomonas haliotis]|uniref:Uncharacterized protein n=1 Tax=Thalassomonas haliotis TaxID=485448 RepID=A0ABY7VGC3_9GAMM|nr:hypothetical protein [Thalassomonas haliotis]WDE12568.1 hypothetical protein H3N35_03560 [Thalassomonas haliotis]
MAQKPLWMASYTTGSMAETRVPPAAFFITGRYALPAPVITDTGRRYSPGTGRNANSQSKNGFFKFVMHAFLLIVLMNLPRGSKPVDCQLSAQPHNLKRRQKKPSQTMLQSTDMVYKNITTCIYRQKEIKNQN